MSNWYWPGFLVYEVLNAPSFNEVYKTPIDILKELSAKVTKHYRETWINDALKNAPIESKIETTFLILNENSPLNILLENLWEFLNSLQILGTEKKFKNIFLSRLQTYLPYYLAYFQDWSLDPFVDKDTFNRQGKSNYSGSQNNGNQINNIKNFDKYNLNTFTEDEKQKQLLLKTNKQEEFLNLFNDLFTGTKYED